ncbi:MAG: LysM peptidoglycan-binding domain-containing protein [Candidatus Riflebacteria bacterium]|nr:LysM peptidoglycan-binding domain-containing protein [Candidatus Riflebacteria bacterium]
MLKISKKSYSNLVSYFLILTFLFSTLPVMAIKTHTMKAGDTLWGLSQQYYGDPTLYQIFLEVNSISNPRTIPIGKVIKVPSYDEMKKIATEVDPVKRKALIQQVTGGTDSSTNTTTTNTTTNTTYNPLTPAPFASNPNSAANTSTVAPTNNQGIDRHDPSFQKVLQGPKRPEDVRPTSSYVKEQ